MLSSPPGLQEPFALSARAFRMPSVESLIEVNGTRIFVDQRGPSDGPPVVYIHGGPGNPSWDFMESVGDLFAARGLRIIGVDQRGVLRSDLMPADPPVSVQVLVDDFEQLRAKLGLESWTLIGHSAGGVYALEYALRHPQCVDALVLDCPAIDIDATDRYRLPRAAALLEAQGSAEAAAECRRLASLDRRLTGDDRTYEPMLQLGDRYLELFLYDADTRARYDAVMSSAPDDFDWSTGMTHLPLLAELYIDRRPMLAELTMPSMMLVGETDMVAPPVVRDAYERATDGDVVTISRAGHFPFVEQPEAYVAAVAGFLGSERSL